MSLSSGTLNHSDESDAAVMRAEDGDYAEILGCFPHLRKEEEDEEGGSDGMDSSEQTLLTYLLERAKRGISDHGVDGRMTLDPSMDGRKDRSVTVPQKLHGFPLRL